MYVHTFDLSFCVFLFSITKSQQKKICPTCWLMEDETFVSKIFTHVPMKK
jgi:hypothetical protein